MKMIVTVAFLFSALNVFADHHEEMKGKTLEEKKEWVNKRLDERITVLQTAKTCVSSATDEAALKKCHEEKREAMKEMRPHKKGKK